MRIAFLTRSLEVGGSERQMLLLARGLADRGHRVLVLSMYPGGALSSMLDGSEVSLKEMHKRGRWDLAGFLLRLQGELKRWRPEVVHSYLDVPNIISALLRPSLGGAAVVWGVRDALADLSAYDRFSRLIRWLTYPISPLAQGIILNSSAARDLHVAKGLSQKNLAVIPNGIDVERFKFDSEGRERLRALWGIKPGELLIGLAARLDPKKDHQAFLKAAALIKAKLPNARFVCIGGGPPDLTQQLKARASALNLNPALIWAGEVEDMAAAFSACDIAVSASYGESFPNTVAEAMACERPVVATNAGDSAHLVGPLGRVIPVRDPAALAESCLQLMSLSDEERKELGQGLRARVVERFSVKVMMDASEAYLQRFIHGRSN